MAKLERRAVQAGYREIRAAVGLYDWLALRFWITLTYDRITRSEIRYS